VLSLTALPFLSYAGTAKPAAIRGDGDIRCYYASALCNPRPPDPIRVRTSQHYNPICQTVISSPVLRGVGLLGTNSRRNAGPQHSLMPIEIEKRRAQWRRAQRKYQQTDKAVAVRKRYRSKDAWHIVSRLRKMTPRARLVDRLYNQEKRSGLNQGSRNLERPSDSF
jgi:hypothetical protein